MNSNSITHGNVWMIWNRWHDIGRPGTYLATFVWGRWGENLTAVVDDFGNLRPVDLKW